MTDNGENARRRLEMATDARKLEIGLFWQRSLFFWGFIATAFIGLAASVGDHPRLALLFAYFGLVCSVCWNLANRGSKYWHEAWEQKVKREEYKIGEFLFSKNEDVPSEGWLSARRYSVSKLVILLSYYVCLVWLAILISLVANIFEYQSLTGAWYEILLTIVTIIFIFAAYKYTKFCDDTDPEAKV